MRRNGAQHDRIGDFDETGCLVLAQSNWRLARLPHRRQMPDEVWLFERDLDEEPQRGAGAGLG
jgi:hypothetical protein